MNTVFLIGNGFDINLDLKTSYRDFYNYYLNKISESDTIIKFKRYLKDSINKEIEDWADLEILLGKYSNELDESQDKEYIEVLNDIHQSLRDYIESIAKTFIVTEKTANKLCKDLFNFDKYLNKRDFKLFEGFKSHFIGSHHNVSSIVFNYTNTFENLYNFEGKLISYGPRYNGSNYMNQLLSIEHVHGRINDNMLLGINDVSQLLNKAFRTKRNVVRRIVKPNMNLCTGTLREERCRQMIDEAHVICVFGMSLGKTDKDWWNHIAKRLNTDNARLIIFAIKDGIHPSQSYLFEEERESIKDRFLSHCDLSPQAKEKILNYIFIGLNSDMFNVKK